KPISRFLSHWEDVAERAVGSSGRCRIGVVGAGAGGVEPLLAVRPRPRTLLEETGDAVDRLDFVLVGDAPRLLPPHPARTRRSCERIFRERGISYRSGFRVAEVREREIRSEAGESIELDEILWVTSAGAPEWIRAAGFDVDGSGFIAVDASLR